MTSTAVDSLDVHTEGHDDLIVTVGTRIVLDTNLNGLVGDLDHLEVVLHLFLE